MKLFFSKPNNQNRGFTLLESLIAITIFTVSILALLSVLSRGIASTTFSKNKIIASYLAEEGIEYVRNSRDTAMISGGTDKSAIWGAFRTSALSVCGTACYLNDAHVLTACSGPCPYLKYDSSAGVYNYTTGTNTSYARSLVITSPSVNELKITSGVSFLHGSATHSLNFVDNLFNWIE